MPIRIVEDAPASPSRVRVVQDAPPKTSQSLGAAKGASKVIGNLGASLPRNVQLLPNALELAGMAGRGVVSKIEQSKNLRAGKTGQALAEILMTLPTMVAGPVMGGAAQGLLTSDAPRGDVLGRAKDAAIGGALGKVGDVGTRAVAKAVGRVVKPPAVVKVDDLKAVKDAAYDAVEKSGVKYAPGSLVNLGQNIAADVGKRLDVRLHPTVVAALGNFQKKLASGPLSINDLDVERKVLRQEIFDRSTKDSEKFFGREIIKHIDDFVNSATPGDVVGAANPVEAATAINTARDFNTRVSKLNKIEEMLETAANDAGRKPNGSLDTEIRNQATNILKKTKNLTEEERRILTAITRGEKTQNVLRKIGSYAMSNGLNSRGPIVAALSYIIGGPAAAAVVGGVAEISKSAGQHMTVGRTQDLMRVMAAGGKPVAATGGFSPQVINAAGKAGAGVSVQSRNLAEALKGNQ